mmetsp:Transcript_26943/g.40783  ORF Transcript_26943/g.40783 Transcript_26943/m.40783 type:complete len:177 (+) Transcript_26943:81-611(+)|eukprot:CAMPEP_0178917342 /NCGR_PEP_ID=MMETSP0786-20121207/13194_1 /TAXON_ID=186022 /ORGANISM="Thalassionema frauenfeldii, Strain CCMP 1798" /LENGTH=176 /DNA_ID=CAMNT_0020590883 /DNA_START=71 /DNA_END=601 /DNA_ORIENTATION=+
MTSTVSSMQSSHSMKEFIDAISTELLETPYCVIAKEIDEKAGKAIIVIKRMSRKQKQKHMEQIELIESKEKQQTTNTCCCDGIELPFPDIFALVGCILLCFYCLRKEKYKFRLTRTEKGNRVNVDFLINAPKEDLGTEMVLNGWGCTTSCRYKKLYATVCKAVDSLSQTKTKSRRA